MTGKIKQNQLDSRDTAPLILLLGLAIDIIYSSTLNLFIYLKRRQFYRCLLKIKTQGIVEKYIFANRRDYCQLFDTFEAGTKCPS